MGFFDRATGSRALVAWAAVLGLLVPLAAGCASRGLTDEGFRHRDHGYRLPHPPAAEGVRWRVVSVEDAHVAYVSADDAYMAHDSRCNEPDDDPAVLGRQLLVGLGTRERIESNDFDFAGGRAFSQLVEAVDETGERVRTRTVTLVRAGCVFDWLLVAAPDHPAHEADFEAWWRSFDPSNGPGPKDQASNEALAEAMP